VAQDSGDHPVADPLAEQGGAGVAQIVEANTIKAGDDSVAALAGALLALLRLRTGNLWHVAGFHWGWNITQKAIFGPPDGAPSLRPLQLHGPPEWVGRPGHPDPGWLQIATTTVMTLVAGLAFRWAERRKHG
jgi:membrane protease YdiL (CAAX protease family)